MTPARLYVGIDWGNASHRVWMTDRAGEPLGDRTFVHRSEGLAALADWIVSVAGDAAAVVVAIEVANAAAVMRRKFEMLVAAGMRCGGMPSSCSVITATKKNAMATPCTIIGIMKSANAACELSCARR